MVPPYSISADNIFKYAARSQETMYLDQCRKARGTIFWVILNSYVSEYI